MGERPRRVVPGKKPAQKSAVKRAGATDDAPMVDPKSPPTKMSGDVSDRKLQQDFDSGHGLLESNPLAEALKLANAHVAELEQQQQALRAEIEQRREEAADCGYREGYEKGLEQGFETYRERIKVLEEIIGQYNGRFEGALDEVEDAAVELTFAAIGKILYGQLSKRETIANIVRNMKDRLACDARQLIVHVSHDDLQLLTESVEGQIELPEGIRLVADDRVRYGGCIIEADSGNLDARLEVQLQELLELFVRARQQRREGGV